MLSGEKVLLTGSAGRIAFPLARPLAADNELWGVARSSDPATRGKVDALGVTTRLFGIANGNYAELPTGSCRVGWRDGFRRLAAQSYPDQVLPPGHETRSEV